jgi:hypothetical protein
MVRIFGHALRLGKPAQRKKHDTPAGTHGRIGHRKRQAASPANDSEGSFTGGDARCSIAHGPASQILGPGFCLLRPIADHTGS